MDTIETNEQRAEALSALVTEKFGPRGPDLRRQARKLGRRVPASVRADLDLVGEAVGLARHPKLGMRHSPDTIAAAAERAAAHLTEIDPADRRRGALLSWLGDNAVNVLIVLAAFVAVLRWRGFL